jgi:hypothetical protein
MLNPRIIETRRGSAHGPAIGQAGTPRPVNGSARG